VKKILVTGGAGYLGSVLCRKLLDKGYQVRVLDKLLFSDGGIQELYDNKKFQFIYGDIRDAPTIKKAIKKMDAVIHLAAIVNDPASAVNPELTEEVNYHSSRELAKMCWSSGVNRFIYSSTCSVYGASKSSRLLTEKSKLNPVSIYGKTKLMAEKDILEFSDYGFSPTVFRMATLHGVSPRMRFDLAVNVMTAMAKYKKQFKVFGGEQWRAFCHIQDAADAYLQCLETPTEKVNGEIFNISTENQKIIELGKHIELVVPDSKMIVDEKNVDIRNYRVSGKKFGLKNRFTISDSIQEIMNGSYMEFEDDIYHNYRIMKVLND